MKPGRHRVTGNGRSAVDSRRVPNSGINPVPVLINAILPPARSRLRTACRLLVAAVLALPANAAGGGGRWGVLLVGDSGSPELQERYLREIADFRSVLEGPLEFPRGQIAVLFDDPSKQPGLIHRKADRENVREVFRDFAGRVNEDDLVLFFIEGHGAYDGKTYKLNLVGPDLTAEELAEALYAVPARNFVVINSTSCSGGSLPAFSRKGSVVITATKSGMEKNLTHAGRFFVDAFKNNAADPDKNGRVSILEAFMYASQKVEAYYESEGNLQTEHPVLNDNGDARAENNPAPENGEGLLARTTFLDAGKTVTVESGWTSEKQKLLLEAREVENQIEALKYAKGTMPEPEYEKKLLELFLKLARINAKLRDK